MSSCPVCDQTINADQAAFEHHINSHFDNPSGESSASAQRPDACPICDFPLSFLTSIESESHINTCLGDVGVPPPQDEDDIDFDYSSAELVAQQKRDEEMVDPEWDGPAKPGKWMDWAGRKVDKGDRWWNPNVPSDPSSIPPNYSPNLIPLLASTLRTTVHQKTTRRAVLARPSTAHIKGVWKFDLGWGCGYRNCLMALTSLLSVPEYAAVFDSAKNGADPGVRRMQGWIEEAWAEGYDLEGQQQLGGRVLGRRKWIGPSDMYAMLSYKGIPCRIYDFPKAQNLKTDREAHTRLQQWVKTYFVRIQARQAGGNAFDTLMRSGENGQGRGELVRISDKFPLILQHSGHSRTIVGYEENARGDINLLLFDPGKTVPKAIRSHALSSLPDPTPFPTPPRPPLNPTAPANPTTSAERIRHKSSSSSHSKFERTHESRDFSPPYTDGFAEIDYSTAREGSRDGSSRVEGSAPLRGGGSTAEPALEDDEERTPSGWVRKKRPFPHLSKTHKPPKSSKPGSDPTAPGQAVKTLNHFRVNLGTLSRHAQYQVLMFTGEEVLGEVERGQRKKVRSVLVR
ncbi:hypothetical protein I350_02412 [Cryptococcus amylolentus CBS 6273]|uniref:UFSP1/2/DUB catalytic domain-containing protein n=1 Tax=Cryptococcus amylolentus CBS 6273 TaxID=1296118 RepID=A0A1E3KBF3_9TREE|nr:hypothetical protein I350_02412 [Cryptococcus amylolentus CBS 6273]